jgi:ABC-type glycerol-3-phosphate transport system substrate-binding protein
MNRYRTSRRSLIERSLAAAGTAVLAACRSQAQPGRKDEGGPVVPRELRDEIVFWPRSISDENTYRAILPLMQQRYPNITVRLEQPGGSLVEKLQVAVAGGTPPDGVTLGLNASTYLIGQGVFASLQRYLSRDKEVAALLQKEFVPVSVEVYTYRNELYAIPVVNESIVFWYNKDALLEAGLTPPAEIENDPQRWNWNTVLEYARKVNRGSGFERARFGFDTLAARGIAGLSESWGNLVYSNDGRFISSDRTRWTMNTPPVRAAIEWIVDLQFKYDVSPSMEAMQRARVRDRDLFTQGRLAMVVQGEYFRRYLWGSAAPQGGLPFQYDLALLPFAPGKMTRAAIYHGNGLFMVKDSKKHDAMWAWLSVMATREAQQIVTDKWGSRGAHRGTYESWLARNADGGPPGLNYAAIIKADSYAQPYPNSPKLAIEQLLEPTVRYMYDFVFTGQMSPAEGLRRIDEETNARLAAA